MLIRTLKQIADSGFQNRTGPNAWYYPNGVNQGDDQVCIHIGGSVNYYPNEVHGINFVSIGPHGNGQRLNWLSSEQRWDIDTPNIDGYGYKGELAEVLTSLRIATPTVV